AEDADGVAADVDRRGDRGDHLVATQDAPGARGAVATGRDARLVLDRGDDHLAAAARRVPPVGVMPLGGRDVALVPLPRGGLALAPPLAVAAGEPPAALAVAVVDRPALALADLGAALAAGEGVAEHRDRRAADVDRRGDRGDHLVATQDALAPGGAVATGRDTPAARSGRRPALAPGEGVAEHRDRRAADVDRRGDRGDHLVATQD